MKKFFAAALATAMVVSMAATSFAAAAGSASGSVKGIDDTLLKYSSKENKFSARTGNLPYGGTAFYQLLDKADVANVQDFGSNYVTKYDAVKGLSLKQKWEMNGSAIEKIEVVKKKHGANSTDYSYYLAVKAKANNSTKSTDVVGTITLKKSGSDGYQFANELTHAVNLVLGYAELTSADVTDETSIMFGDAMSETGEITVNFVEAPENYFEVNVDGQGKLLVKADVEYNAEVAAKYPNANLDFFNGNGASFNKIGVMTISAEPGSFLYANNDGVLTAVKATYDEYEEAFKVKTRTLGSYVISDVELKAPVVTPTEPTKPNPGTGANA